MHAQVQSTGFALSTNRSTEGGVMCNAHAGSGADLQALSQRPSVAVCQHTILLQAALTEHPCNCCCCRCSM